MTSNSTMIELSLSAKHLINRDTTSKSDPFVVVYQREPRTREWIEFGRTETIQDNLSPTWVTKFTLEYKFEERQKLKFIVYDSDGKAKDLSQHDYLGEMESTLGEIIAAPYSKVCDSKLTAVSDVAVALLSEMEHCDVENHSLKMKRKNHYEKKLSIPKNLVKAKAEDSLLIIHSEELGTNKETFQMILSGKGLDKKDLLGKSDPFLIISKKTDEGTWTQVFTTEAIKKTLDPEWRPLVGQTVQLTHKNPETPLLFQVFDFDKNLKHDLIGEFETTFKELLKVAKGTTPASIPLINKKKKEKKKNYEHSGTLNVSLKVDETNYTFIDYLASGVQLHFTVAIDFTASNGNPNDPKSLHYRKSEEDNLYTTAIKAVGSIMEQYDYDKAFPGLGFGAKINQSTEVSHLFFLNFDPQNPFCEGVNGILDAYKSALPKVKLYGPTFFAPVINHLIDFANTYQDGRHYFVLLILTDGMICDLDATRESIVKASRLPLSIVIVGVGDEDFSSMDFLDADKRALKHNGVLAARDIVQFVPLRDFIKKDENNPGETKTALARKVLAELPKQFTDYMQLKKATAL